MKKLLGVDVPGFYEFIPDGPGAGTITFSGISLKLSQILLIVNVTASNTIIYNFADAATGSAGFIALNSGKFELTLAADTGAMNATDELLIYVDVAEPQMIDIPSKSGLGFLLARILSILAAPLGYRKDTQRYQASAVLESGTVTTVSTVTTCSTVSNLVNMNGLASDRLVLNQNYSAWAAVHRARIS
jgi:hypothetical protein